MKLPVKNLNCIGDINKTLVADYRKYIELRLKFLLKRFHRYPDFPGVHTGYNSITGEDFDEIDNLPYAWINGRGICVLSRFAKYFPERASELDAFAGHIAARLERHWEINHHHFPFIAELDGREKVTGCPCPDGYKSYSDLYCGMGFLEYGTRNNDDRCLTIAENIFSETIQALKSNRFATEPSPTPEDRILENPFSVALDFANEFYKQTGHVKYLQAGAELVTKLLDAYYIKEHSAFIEYAALDGTPFENENNDYIVDPGHALEFCGFAIEFARLAGKTGLFSSLREQINVVTPDLVLWNFTHGWNKKHPGIYKTIEAVSRNVINSTMPWWILPETMLSLVLAYEMTEDNIFLDKYIQAHNAYFNTYMNPKTNFGPYQNIAGTSGKPVDIVPACKFQDPEFHSGRNILMVTQVLVRLGLA